MTKQAQKELAYYSLSGLIILVLLIQLCVG